MSHPELLNLVLDEDGHEVLVLLDVCPVVLLGDAAVLAGRESQLQPQLTLDVGARRAPLQLEPLVYADRRDFLQQHTTMAVKSASEETRQRLS